MKKRIYLDVDGVLNALPYSRDTLTEANTGWGDETWTTQKARGYKITWSSDLVDAINELQEAGVEFRWLTTWCEYAGEDIGPMLGLYRSELWPVTQNITNDQVWQYHSLGDKWWKEHLILADLAEDPADLVVWVDDDHPIYNVTADENVLVVAPDSRFGITRDNIDVINSFLKL